MEKLTNIINTLLANLVIALFFSLLLCVLWQVLSRYVLASPSTFTDESARLLFIWTGLLGAAYATGQKQHLAIDLLPQSLRGKSQRRLRMGIDACFALFALLVLITGGTFLVNKVVDTGQMTPVMSISMAYGYAAIPVSGLFILYFSIASLCQSQLDSKTSQGS